MSLVTFRPLRKPEELPSEFDAFQQDLVLSAFPGGSAIAGHEPCHKDHCAYPIRVTVRTLTRDTSECVVKNDRTVGGLELEDAVLPVLREYGLRVPEVLAGPVIDPAYPDGGPLTVLSLLPGSALPFVGASLDELDLTCRLFQVGIRALHALTKAIRSSSVVALLPENTLQGELEVVVTENSPWLEDRRFREAIDTLRQVLDTLETPLVFSNGDYNPYNFLHDGEELTGWLDFSFARFGEPLVGICKFMLWSFDCGWAPAAKCGLVERFLSDHGVGFSTFTPRLCLRALRMLQHEMSVSGEKDAQYREHVLALLEQSLRAL